MLPEWSWWPCILPRILQDAALTELDSECTSRCCSGQSLVCRMLQRASRKLETPFLNWIQHIMFAQLARLQSLNVSPPLLVFSSTGLKFMHPSFYFASDMRFFSSTAFGAPSPTTSWVTAYVAFLRHIPVLHLSVLSICFFVNTAYAT
jgi:hypothetical protein